MKKPVAGLAIMVWSCDLRDPERAATPFMAAQAAAALDIKVEMLFVAQAVQWLLPEYGDRLIGFGPKCFPVRHYLESAADLEIDIRACSQALNALGRDHTEIVMQCSGIGGMVAFIVRGQELDWHTMVF
jgi:predicted peroxiredoxin